MKVKVLFLTLYVLFAFCDKVLSQTGPGGIGDNTNNVLWLNSSNITGITNGNPVASWSDISGNGNNAGQIDVLKQPTYLTNRINGHASVSFDGSDDFISLNSNITSQDVSVFLVYSQPTPASLRAPLNLGSHFYFSSVNDLILEYPSTPALRFAKSDNSFSVLSHHANSGTNQTKVFNANTTSTKSFTSFPTITQSTIGASFYNSVIQYNFDGEFAEVIVFNEELNSAERRIVGEYLGGKYNLTTESNLYGFSATHANEIFGIGQESDGSNSTARGTGQLEVSAPSALANGDYMILGHDNGGFTETLSVGAGVASRWSQVWKASVVGSPGTVSLEFFLNGNDLSGSDYVVLIDDDGNFTNGGTVIHDIGQTNNIGADSWSFSGVSIANGNFITLGLRSGAIVSQVAAGNWNSTGTWSCSCIPDLSDNVTILNGHTVTIDNSSSVFSLTIEGGLDFLSTDTLYVFNQLTVNGSLDAGNGVIAAVKDASPQEFHNNGVARLDLNSLFVNNSSGLSLMSGGWAISKSLQVSSGGFNVSNADSIVLLSDASASSEILTSMNNAFTGDFVIQRHIGARPANFANFSSPIVDGTVNDLDDDLILSGVNGRSGTAQNGNGTTFFSVHSFTAIGQTHEDVDDIADPLLVGKGYEVYLASTLTNFNGATVDYRGVPNVGEISFSTLASPSTSDGIYFNQNWNLLGNPYHAFIDFDLITKDPFMSEDYYIFNSTNGSYDFIAQGSPDLIAPSQGFWFFNIAFGNRWMTFDENIKSTSNSSAFLRTKKENDLSLELLDIETGFNQKMFLKLEPSSTNLIDEEDRPFLASPINESPGIYSFASNSSKKLVVNATNPSEESKVIPISIYSGTDGVLKISAKNLDNLHKNYDCVYLQDNIENKIIDLSVDNDYEFESQIGNFDRFNLFLSNNYEECNKSIDSRASLNNESNSTLNLRKSNGILYLDYSVMSEELSSFEINIFSLNGQKVNKNEIFSSSESGAYPIRSVNNLKGIYIIQVISKDEIFNQKINL